ncbi:RloB family protein [Calidifontibacillus oryziterrae]|uniref:RloB family protein n=1 Tax=Calidifontibacillus oryziterrae TaxID=1191699 RepID=UPI000315B45D|nr:RloB family protein [Calidifontibacillus oryziterrae]
MRKHDKKSIRKILETFRNPRHREPRKRILILCEGQTEVKYIKNFKSRRVNIKVISQRAKFRNPDGMIKEMLRKIKDDELYVRSGIDEAWCIYDIDTEPEDNKILQNITNARKNYINVAYSNPCFELWFLIHFEKCSTHLQCTEILNRLKNYLPNYQKGKDIYNQISDKTTTAIQNAQYLEHIQQQNLSQNKYKNANPYTTVYQLTSRLLEVI